ncbi:HNH endonuclease [Nocardia aurea]|uniref:HNH endonuclease n=1 Tax=Nocardia aurea TaxID=2144174 RepID=UPI00339E4683
MPWSMEPDRYRGVPTSAANRIRERDEYTCQACGRPGHEVDHVENVKSGGTDDEYNLQVLCSDCHKPKIQVEAAAGRAKRSRRRPARIHPGLR